MIDSYTGPGSVELCGECHEQDCVCTCDTCQDRTDECTCEETVRLHVTVRVDYDNPDYDTGLTVAEWNALTPEQRGRWVTNAWEVAAQTDDGGIRVVTEGAEDA